MTIGIQSRDTPTVIPTFLLIRWVNMLRALRRDFRVPYCPLLVMQDYMRDRKLSYYTYEWKKSKTVTAGDSRVDSLLSPVERVGCDGLLHLKKLHGVFLGGYDNDLTSVISARAPDLKPLRMKQVGWANGWPAKDWAWRSLRPRLTRLTQRRIPTVIP